MQNGGKPLGRRLEDTVAEAFDVGDCDRQVVADVVHGGHVGSTIL
jgi:hypothetical protein